MPGWQIALIAVGAALLAGAVSAAVIRAVIGEGLKPLTTSQRPSDNSQAATGSAASTVQEGAQCRGTALPSRRR